MQCAIKELYLIFNSFSIFDAHAIIIWILTKEKIASYNKKKLKCKEGKYAAHKKYSICLVHSLSLKNDENQYWQTKKLCVSMESNNTGES